jgi:hypothetical protein
MSLKGFHIVFVSLCLALFTFMVIWGFLLAPERGVFATAVAVAGIAGVLLTPVYAVYFLRKARRIGL